MRVTLLPYPHTPEHKETCLINMGFTLWVWELTLQGGHHKQGKCCELV